MDNLDDVVETVLEARYLQQDEEGNVVETPAELFDRVARDLGVKGITVFRSGSRREQILGEDPLKEECASECDWVPLDEETSAAGTDAAESNSEITEPD